MANRLINGGKPFGKGMAGAELNEPDLVDFISAYRRRVAGNYRPLLLDDFGALPASGLLVSTKIDYAEERRSLCGSNIDLYFAYPVLTQIKKHLRGIT